MFIAISLCLGIATAYFLMQEHFVWAILFILVFVVLSAIYLLVFTDKKFIKRNLIFIAILIFFYLFGAFGVNTQIDSFCKADLNGGYYTVTGKVKSAVQTESGSKLILENVNVKGSLKGNLKYKLAVVVYGENDIDIGDVVVFSQHIYNNSHIYEGKFNAYDIERGIRYSTSVSSSQITVTANNLTIFERINLFMRDSLKNGLDKDEFSVGYAMLTGEDSFMDYDLISAYRTAGVAHIFAVSGLHIGFLAGVLGFLFDKIRIKGYVKAVTISSILFLYSGVCGFYTSSIRATIMVAVLLFSQAKGYRYDMLSSISLAGILILVCSPINLLCVGFQLSFAVVIGICLFSKQFAKLFKFLPKKVASAIGVVISAQLVGIPICIANFGYFSWISICINLIFLPFVSVIYVLTFFTCILGGVFSISAITLFIPNYILKFVNMCIPAFDNKIFMVGDVVLGGSALAFYLALIIPCKIINVKKVLTAVLTFSLVGVFIVSASLHTYSHINSTKILVSGSEKLSATLISTPDESTLIVSHAEYVYSTSRLKRMANSAGVEKLDNLVFMGGYPVDMQVFITKLRTVFEVGNVYYYGEKNEQMESVVNRSFGIVNVKNCKDGQSLILSKTKLTYGLSGTVLNGQVNGKRIAIFSSFKNIEPAFTQFNGYNLDFIICYDRADVILAKYKPKTPISYLYSSNHLNAQSSGNLSFNLGT